jgi:hypothetical protein
MQDAADEGLIGNASLQCPCTNRLEITAGEANIDALILLARRSFGFTQTLQEGRCCHAEQYIAIIMGWVVVVVVLGFSTGNDGLQEEMLVCFHVGHKMHVARPQADRIKAVLQP